MVDEDSIKIIAFAIIAFCGCIIWMGISSAVVADYREIKGYDDCTCLFNDSTKFEKHFDFYPYVDIETIALCDKEYLKVDLTWPPGKPWYKQKTTDEVRNYITSLLVDKMVDCKIDINSRKGVTENIHYIAGWIVSLVLSLIVILAILFGSILLFYISNK